jgi:hypothetical protein
MKRISWLALAVLGCTVNVAWAQQDGDLAAEDITTVVKGKRLAGERSGGGQVRVRFADDGSLSIQDGHAVLTGKWAVQDDKLCMQVAKWNHDECGKLSRSGSLITHYMAGGDKIHIVFGK